MQMFLNAVRRDGEGGSVDLAVNQGGVGLFDAFFASLSMILVSEVSLLWLILFAGEWMLNELVT